MAGTAFHLAIISIWGCAIGGWYTAWYFYQTANKGTAPNMGVVFKCIIATAVSLFIGCVCYSFMQASILGRSW